MVKEQFNKRNPLWFKHFNRKGYSLFAALGKEVLISVLSVSTLTYAKADGVSVCRNLPNDQLTNQAVKLSEVVVTGSRAPLTVSQQSRMVTVLSRKDIESAPVQSVNDLLKLAIGVDVRQKGPLGALTDVGIRGGNSEQVTILLNGINICDAQTAHNAFDIPVDLSEIERIEVLEGPAGRVYGTSSLLGAINIVTKAAARTSLTARMEGGSYGYLSTGLRGNIARNNWNNQLSLSATRSDGYSRSKAGNLNADYHTLKSFYQGSYQDSWVDVKWHAGMSLKDFGSNTFYGVKWDNQFEHTFKTFTA
ncbi:TonB-dependent receptor, partial [Hoylesella buccalis]